MAAQSISNTDSISLPKAESDSAFTELGCRIEALTRPIRKERDLLNIISPIKLPNSFYNMLLIVSADAARRRDWLNLAQDLAANCTNPVLVHLWEKWFASCKDFKARNTVVQNAVDLPS
jgi:hypothetical protein